MFTHAIKRPLKALKLCGIFTASLLSLQLHAMQCDYQVSSDWGTGFTASISITNDSETTISDWDVTWSYASSTKITNIWQAELIGEAPFHASDLGWNSTIEPGSSVSFGFQGEGSSAMGAILSCGDNDTSSGTDTGVDTGTDTGADTGSDTGADTGSDTGADTGSDTGADTGSDTGADTGSDTGADTGSDTGADTGSDTGTDTGSDTGTYTGSDSGADTSNGDIANLSAVEFTKLMGVGWNAGNTLDAVGGETAWGNPLLTQKLFDAVKAAGFKTVRLPVAWSQFSDADNFVIKQSWMDRVEEVVNYALNADLYVVINMHWDGGWMQPTYAQQDYVNNRLAIMWKQIATRFIDYDNRLLFAGTNEVMVDGDYGTPTSEYYSVQNSFNQTFVTTVRDTGGNNAQRFLVIQGFNTNIDHAVNFAQIPADSANKRLMMEVHYYDPYNFTLNENSNITQWGAIATDASKTESWANETYADGQFQKMKSAFVDQGIGVILGEYGVISKLSIADHETYRVYWNKYITHSALEHQIVPIYWDNGYTGDKGLGIFDRNSGAQVNPDLIKALVE